MRASRWAAVLAALVAAGVIGGCSVMAKRGHAHPPGEIVLMFTGDTAGEVKGCG
jgi:hypothetical protein